MIFTKPVIKKFSMVCFIFWLVKLSCNQCCNLLPCNEIVLLYKLLHISYNFHKIAGYAKYTTKLIHDFKLIS